VKSKLMPFAVCCLLCDAVLAQHWYIEQVDSAGWGASVEMRWHPDGRLFLCYSNASGDIRLAWPDVVWQHEDLPRWNPTWPGTQAFDINGRGDIGVSYISTDNRYWYAYKAESGWVNTRLPFVSFCRSPVTLDKEGNPAITIQYGDAFLLARRRDTSWVTESIATGYSGMNSWFGCSSLGTTPGGALWGVFWYHFIYPFRDIHGMNLYSFCTWDSGITVNPIAQGAANLITGESGCTDQAGAVHASYGHYCTVGIFGMYLDQTRVNSDRIAHSAVEFDSVDRARIAYTGRDSSLAFSYADRHGWHFLNVGVVGVVSHDLTLAAEGVPLIACATTEGVFLVRGVDVIGQAEEPREPTADGLQMTASVIRNVLLLPVASSRKSQAASCLLDISGRRVMELRPGANDVSRLAPAVYFVVTPSPSSSPSAGERAGLRGRIAVSGERSAVTKVVVTR